MTISGSKTQIMYVGKRRNLINCVLNGSVLEQVSQFKYFGCVFSEDRTFDKEFEHQRVNGNKIVAQLRSHVFNKHELHEAVNLSRVNLQTNCFIQNRELSRF